MRIIVATVVLTIATLYSLGAYAQETDPHDYNLIVYPISPIQEAQFQGQSGNIAGFWSGWAGRDYIDMTTTQNGKWLPNIYQWSGPDDAECKVRAASGAKGLYLLFDVIDNSWVPFKDFFADCLDFLLDKLSADTIMNANPYALYLQPLWGWTLTNYTIQFQINIGDTGLPSQVWINGGCMMGEYYGWTIQQLSSDLNGMSLNLKMISATERQLEMFIPWVWVGCNGGLGSEPAAGTKFAMSGGYNDQDSGMPNSTCKVLRWHEKDPFNTCDDMVPPHTYCDAWGDLEIAGSTAIEPSRHSRMPGIAPTKIAYFTLRGETIPVSRIGMMAPGTLVVKSGSISGGVSKPCFIGVR